ncbi:MAG TPA: hypothetical protein VHA57_08815 [Actinomycetota bacterium]|nr:hypothetical protein [Actinomycetota bacterium]
MAAISDPLERAREITRAMGNHQSAITTLAQLRREAISEARQTGMTQAQIAKAIGVTQGRISQVRPTGVLTGWLVPESDAAEPKLTISGSRAEGTDARLLDEAVRSLGQLLVQRRCRVTHGPVGVGVEVITHIADHYRPPALGAVTGVFGRPNVVRDADLVLILGGGEGTLAEFELAASMGKTIAPWPATGGTARKAYEAMRRQPELRKGLTDDDFEALAAAQTGDEYIGMVERLLPRDAKVEGRP